MLNEGTMHFRKLQGTLLPSFRPVGFYPNSPENKLKSVADFFMNQANWYSTYERNKENFLARMNVIKEQISAINKQQSQSTSSTSSIMTTIEKKAVETTATTTATTKPSTENRSQRQANDVIQLSNAMMQFTFTPPPSPGVEAAAITLASFESTTTQYAASSNSRKRRKK